MFQLADGRQIGAYLREVIAKCGYPSVRQFGKACREAQGLPTDDEELRKMSNKLSQILQGKKGVQLEDLPVFTGLLGISCEELLSAGRCRRATVNRLTNYSVAMSEDERDWAAYLEREEKPIQNADEYGKTLIDYALDAENYELMKYLMDRKLIWFVGAEESGAFPCNFAAGTSIGTSDFWMRNHNVMGPRLGRPELRMAMIRLAIRRGDVPMLEALRAREIPSLYMVNCVSPCPLEREKFYNPELIDALCDASDEVLEYFSAGFEVQERLGRKYPFVFPFFGVLLDRLIERRHGFAQWMLKDAIGHNRNVLDRLTAMFEAAVAFNEERYADIKEEEWPKWQTACRIMERFGVSGEEDLVFFYSIDTRDGIVSNLVKVEADSEDVQLRRLIREVNELYEQIRNLTPKIWGGYVYGKTDL